MANLTSPRPKKRVYQSEEAPFPVPIETITKKQATDGHWFFYTGHLAKNCVLVKREGDIIFLYKMGFFGKGLLSKSKPQHHKFESSFQGLRRKNLPPKERQFQQQRFQQVRHHKYERHLSWQRLLAQQIQQKQRKKECEIETEAGGTNSGETSSIDTQQSSSFSDRIYVSELETKTTTDVQTNSANDIPSTSTVPEPKTNTRTNVQQTNTVDDVPSTSTVPEPKTNTRTDVQQTNTANDVSSISIVSDQYVQTSTAASTPRNESEDFMSSSHENTKQLKQREWMREGFDISDLSNSAFSTTNETNYDDKADDAYAAAKDTNNDDKADDAHAAGSDGSGEELIIVSDEEGEETMDTSVTKTTEHVQKKRKVAKKSDPFQIYEYLQLSFEEAFFLSFGLGCLSVLDEEEKPIMLSRMWRTFCSRQSNFLPNYVVYHYLRSKGWVPKAGAKYGADFVLYKKGPPFYHASYSVIVNMIDEHTSQDVVDKRFWNWNALTGMNRITENVAKEVLVCYVLKPPGMLDVDLASPKCIRKFKVQEVIMKRWVSSRERESNNTEPLIS